MRPERQIRAKDFILNINSGMSDEELMQKYKLSYKGLQSVYNKLLDAQLIDRDMILDRLKDSPESTYSRRIERKEIFIPLPLREIGKAFKGQVLDISLRGVGAKGIPAEVGQRKHLLVLADDFFTLRKFSFFARCRWAKENIESAESLAGFEIVSISPADLENLKRMIETFDYMFR
jgi:hypothetical protein